MGETRKMHMVADVVHGADGLSVLFGPGELHDPGSLPDGVRYREVLADDEAVALAPAHVIVPPEPVPAPKATGTVKSTAKSTPAA